MSNKRKRREIEGEAEIELLTDEKVDETDEATPEPEAIEVNQTVVDNVAQDAHVSEPEVIDLDVSETVSSDQLEENKPDESATAPSAVDASDADEEARLLEERRRWLKRRRR